LFSAFRCLPDPDIEGFIYDKAFLFQQRGWSSVYLIVDGEKLARGEQIIEAYFTLSHKAIMLKDTVSRSLRKKIWGGVINDDPIAHFVLIGHLGKYIGPGYTSSITVARILEYALKVIDKSRELIAFTSILVECKDEPRLIGKYTENGFGHLQVDGLVQLMRRI
jgi:hypothetical protein